MEENTAKMWRRISKYRKQLATAVATILIIVSWISTYFLSASALDTNTKSAWIVIVATLINIAATSIVFVGASVLFGREDDERLEAKIGEIFRKAQTRPVSLSANIFPGLIDNASEIDFVVQGWNGWAVQEPIAKSLTHFFERDGVFRLYVCNPETNKSRTNRTAMERRLGKSPIQIVDEIRETIQTISEARDSVASMNRGSLEIFQTDELNWYFAAYFRSNKKDAAMGGSNVLILSVYSHSPGSRPWDMPALQLTPEIYPRLQTWFEKELDLLRGGVPAEIETSMHHSPEAR